MLNPLFSSLFIFTILKSGFSSSLPHRVFEPSETYGEDQHDVEGISSKSSVGKFWAESKVFWKVLREYGLENRDFANVSTECVYSLKYLLNGIKEYQAESVEIVDASAPLPSGIIAGTISEFGDYDQCLGIQRTFNYSTEKTSYTGKYCLAQIQSDFKDEFQEGSFAVSNNYDIQVGLCLPSTCSYHDVYVILKQYNKMPFKIRETAVCDTSESTGIFTRQFTTSQKLSLIFVSTVCVLVLLATLVDIHARLNSTTLPKRIKRMSLLMNTIKLIAPTEKERNKAADSTRIVWVFIIIAGHYIFCMIDLRLLPKLENLNSKFAEFNYMVATQFIMNFLHIELMFFIGGLVSFLALQSAIRGGKAITEIIANRWLRRSTGLLCLLAIEFLWPLFGSGPMFTDVTAHVVKNCGDHWWGNILFISNWFPYYDMCMVHSWYLSVDFQLFVILLFVLAIFRINEKAGVACVILAILTGMFLPGYYTYVYNVFPCLVLYKNKLSSVIDYLDTVYFQTSTHLTPYFMGVLFIHLKRTYPKIFHFRSSIKVTGSIIAAFLLLFLTFIPSIWNVLQYPADWFYSSLIYATFSRLLYVGSFSWFLAIIPTLRKRKAPVEVQKPLEKPAELPIKKSKIRTLSLIYALNKLSFSLYLIHAVYIRYSWSTSRTLFRASVFNLVFRGAEVVFVSIVWSVPFYLLFEAPFSYLSVSRKKKVPTFDLEATRSESKV